MSEQEWQEEWAALDWDERRTKMQLQLFVSSPNVFTKQSKEWIND